MNPDFPVSDPTVFQKRYLKKIRELGEVSGILNSGILGLGKLGKLLSLSGSKILHFNLFSLRISPGCTQNSAF